MKDAFVLLVMTAGAVLSGMWLEDLWSRRSKNLDRGEDQGRDDGEKSPNG